MYKQKYWSEQLKAYTVMKRNGCTQFQWVDLSMKTLKGGLAHEPRKRSGSSAKKPTAPELENIAVYNRKTKGLEG